MLVFFIFPILVCGHYYETYKWILKFNVAGLFEPEVLRAKVAIFGCYFKNKNCLA